MIYPKPWVFMGILKLKMGATLPSS